MTKQYNYCLDYIKGIACIFVVLMHCEFPGILGTAVQTISRFCVPLFFMVSGYFCYKPESHVRTNAKTPILNRKTIHVLKITINACVFYICFLLLINIFHHVNWSLNYSIILKFLLFNVPFWVAGQYWFLFALLYTYIFYFVIVKFGLIKQAFWLAGSLFIVYIILAQGMHLIGYRIPNMVYRNWLVEGFAFFMLGIWIHHHQDFLKIDNRTLLSIIILSTLLCFVERYLVGRDFGVNIVTIPQVFCLFLYAINNPLKHKGILQIIGKRYSMNVYILHPAIWHSCEYLYKYVRIDKNIFALYALPIIVVIVTILLSHCVYCLNVRLKKTNS